MSSAVAVVGSINRDVIVRSPTLPRPGQTVLGESVRFTHGGKGANQAAASAVTEPARVRTYLIGAVGTDNEGDQELASLEDVGVDISFVARHRGIVTGTAFVIVDDEGSNQIVVVPGANGLLSGVDVAGALQDVQPSVVLISLEVPDEAVAAAIESANSSGAVVILNPAPYRNLAAPLLDMVDILTPNAIEFRQMVGATTREALDEVSIPRLISSVSSRANKLIYLVTLGDRGAVLSRNDTTVHLPASRVEVVDTTGSGDAFNGALAAGIASGNELAAAAMSAVEIASSVVTWPGARIVP